MRKQPVGILLMSTLLVLVLLSPGLRAQEGADGFNFGTTPQAPAQEVTSPGAANEPAKASPGEGKKLDLSPDNYIRHLLGSIIGPFFSEEVVKDNADQIRNGTHPAQKLLDAFNFFQKDQVDSPENQKLNILVAYRVALKREPTADERMDAEKLVREEGIAALVEKLFNNPNCPWKGKYGPAKIASGLAEKIGKTAAGFPAKYPGYKSFPYAQGTEEGNLGCANVVSACLQQAGIKMPMILSVAGVKSALQALPAPQKFEIVRPPPYKPGDVVIWSPPSGGAHGHIGIVAKNGNTLETMNNSSSNRRPIFSPMEYRPVEAVLRLS